MSPFETMDQRQIQGRIGEGYVLPAGGERRMFVSLAPLLRGEGWGEGLHPLVLKMMRTRYPLTRIASATRSDLSPQAGGGKNLYAAAVGKL
jgi:hypothetical protein